MNSGERIRPITKPRLFVAPKMTAIGSALATVVSGAPILLARLSATALVLAALLVISGCGGGGGGGGEAGAGSGGGGGTGPKAGDCVVNGMVIDDHVLPPGTGGNLEITKGECTASGSNTYMYQEVNIYDGGKLTFLDSRTADIQFYARSILIEDKGSLVAGSAAKRFGLLGGKLTFHLWGAPGDPGITCKTGDHCGVPDTAPDDIWGSNPIAALNPASCNTATLPGGVTDCFYAYQPLDDSDKGTKSYFGRKVLAVSYNGTLNLFGDRGATTDPATTAIDPKNTGMSWLRLKGSLKPTDAQLTVDGKIDWKKNDHIVVTTTDYLPEHSEELIISENPTGSTIKFKKCPAAGDCTDADKVPDKGVDWPHNGIQYPLALPARLGITRKFAETRAAVALLTRSIRIVSDGNTAKAPFDATPGNHFGGDTIVRQGFLSLQLQGVEFYQLGKGGLIMHYPVHFHLARNTPQPKNPKKDPPITFVKDCSIHDSMTRWVTIHGTQGVTVARNVGYKSIGHGFYLEDGTETDNKLYSNIGILARAAVVYKDNPRKVPGILTRTAPAVTGPDDFPYLSDSNHPTVFWIMNGWNDFEYNMAVGAGTCGACYWLVPGVISGPSQFEHWFGYAGEQVGPGVGNAGITPLQEFLGNSCTSAMNAFTINSSTADCNGVNSLADSSNNLMMIPSAGADAHKPDAPNDTYWPKVSGGGHFSTRCPEADKGKADAECTASASPPINRCTDGKQQNCDVTALNGFTTAFNWAAINFAAIWLRPQWSLVVNSVISDVQNAGVNFVTGGGYSKSDVITGYWGLARKSVFIGSTQTDNPLASNAGPFNPFTSTDGKVKGLGCVGQPSYCLNKDEGISVQLANFSVGQRLFSIYDGPSYEDSNAFLNIHPTYLTDNGMLAGTAKCQPNQTNGNPCVGSGFMNGGLNGVRAYRLDKTTACYLPNAAIAWKQPNGFYYSPAFHSTNLFFDGVDICHFVIEPLFGLGNIPCSFGDVNACYEHQRDCTATKEAPIGRCKCDRDTDCSTTDRRINNVCDTSKGLCVYGSFVTDLPAMKKDYCFWSDGSFAGFTDIDRETVLNDDDGSLTGLTSVDAAPTAPPISTGGPLVAPLTTSETISVNQEAFFNAPKETTECASDVAANATADPKKMPSTAKTSPYEYVTTVVYPECGTTAPDTKDPLAACDGGNWGQDCTQTNGIAPCYGVPLYRQFLTDSEVMRQNAGTLNPLELSKLMMGQSDFQRSSLTVNHGSYYIDTTPGRETQHAAGARSLNVFNGGQTYYVFFVYSKATTKQIYKLYVGKDLPFNDQEDVKFGHAHIKTGKLDPKNPFTVATAQPWKRHYDKGSGLLEVDVDMTSLADEYDLTKNKLGDAICQPPGMCSWNSGKNQCQCSITDKDNYLYDACHEKKADCADQPGCAVDCVNKPDDPHCIDAICSWSVKDLDCPEAGCPGFQLNLPGGFETLSDACRADPKCNPRPNPTAFSGDMGFDWQVQYNNVDAALSGGQCRYAAAP